MLKRLRLRGSFVGLYTHTCGYNDKPLTAQERIRVAALSLYLCVVVTPVHAKTKPLICCVARHTPPPQPIAATEDEYGANHVSAVSDQSNMAEGEDGTLSCADTGNGDDDSSDTVQFVGRKSGGGDSSSSRRVREREWDRVAGSNRGRRAAGAIRTAASSLRGRGGGRQDGETRWFPLVVVIFADECI